MRITRFQAIKIRLRAYFNYFIIILALFLTVSLIGNIASTQNTLKSVEKKEKEVQALADRNSELKKTLERVQSEAFIEKQIRDQLGLAREGEIVLVLPDENVLKSLVPKLPQEEEELPDPIWRKWLKLFL